MASKKAWEKVSKYFKPDSVFDNWGDPDAISEEHLFRLFDLRNYLNVPIYVLHGVKSSGHSKASQHYPRANKNGKIVGTATDIVIPDYPLTIFDLLNDVSRFGFTGIGYYPHWHFDNKVIGGLHLDSRDLKKDKDGTYNYKHSRWMGVMRGGQQVYIPLTYKNIINNRMKG